MAAESEVLLQTASAFTKRRALDRSLAEPIADSLIRLGVSLKDSDLTEVILMGYVNQHNKSDLKSVFRQSQNRFGNQLEIKSAFFESLMRRWNSYEAVVVFYNQMLESGVQATAYTYHIMLEKAIDAAKNEKKSTDFTWIKNVKEIFKKVLSAPVPDAIRNTWASNLFDVILNRKFHLERAENHKILLGFLRDFKISLSQESASSFYLDLIQSHNYDFEEVKQLTKGIPEFENDSMHNGAALKRTDNKQLVAALKNKFEQDDRTVSTDVYRTMLWRLNTQDLKVTLEEQLPKWESETVESLASAIFCKMSNYDICLRLYEEMRIKGVKIPDYVYYFLMERAPSFAQAWEIYRKLKVEKSNEAPLSKWYNPLYFHKLLDKKLSAAEIQNLLLPELVNSGHLLKDNQLEHLLRCIMQDSERQKNLWEYLKDIVSTAGIRKKRFYIYGSFAC